MSFRGCFWTKWNVEITQEFQELRPTNTSLDQPVNMDTTMFNQKQGQDAGTIIVTIPLSTRRIVTNARFLDLMMEPNWNRSKHIHRRRKIKYGTSNSGDT